jgi:hypothetical protein
MATFPSKVDYATGDILTATNMNDIGGAINLLDGAQFAAGKNKIINGDFRVNQRAFTSTTSDQTYGFDRWVTAFSDGTSTYSAQTFTLGAAPVAGYEGTNFARIASTGQTLTTALTSLAQRIESVRTLAGQTATISFWAKAAAGTPNVVVWINQSFGSGGSPSASVNTGTTKQAITTSWARYSFTVAIPSISGKTIGTANDDRLNILITTSAGSSRSAYTDSLGIQTATIDIWGVQVEAANTASNFQTATGTIQGELAACQRYYWRGVNNNAYTFYTFGGATAATTAEFIQPLPVNMRVNPTSVDYSTMALQGIGGGAVYAVTAAALGNGNSSNAVLSLTVASGLTTSTAYRLITNNSTSGYIGFSAEL